MTLPIWAWAGTLAVFAVLVAADLVLTRKAIGWRAAVVSSALWIAAALAFGAPCGCGGADRGNPADNSGQTVVTRASHRTG